MPFDAKLHRNSKSAESLSLSADLLFRLHRSAYSFATYSKPGQSFPGFRSRCPTITAWGNARGGLRAMFAWQPSVPASGCHRVDRGCPARPHSRHQSSGRCGSRSVRLSAIQDDLALSFRLVGLRSGSRYPTSSGYPCDATYLSERPNWSGRDELQNSG